MVSVSLSTGRREIYVRGCGTAPDRPKVALIFSRNKINANYPLDNKVAKTNGLLRYTATHSATHHRHVCGTKPITSTLDTFSLPLLWGGGGGGGMSLTGYSSHEKIDIASSIPGLASQRKRFLHTNQQGNATKRV